MGVTITATNSSYSFDMGSGGFFNLRKNIATALDSEFGENYAKLIHCYTNDEYAENDIAANEIIESKNLDEHEDILRFLYAPDTDGKASPKTCRNIYELIKDVDFGNKGFRYAAYMHNDYEEFKSFLLECAENRRYMRWY